MTMNRKMTIWLEPPAMRSKILIKAISLRIAAKTDGNQRSNGSSSRMFFDFRLLRKFDFHEKLLEIILIGTHLYKSLSSFSSI